jgi:hypothetical protein
MLMWESNVRIFLITLLVSTVASIVFWQFGLAGKIWPAHPFVAALVLAALCGIVIQLVLTYETPV